MGVFGSQVCFSESFSNILFLVVHKVMSFMAEIALVALRISKSSSNVRLVVSSCNI